MGCTYPACPALATAPNPAARAGAISLEARRAEPSARRAVPGLILELAAVEPRVRRPAGRDRVHGHDPGVVRERQLHGSRERAVDHDPIEPQLELEHRGRLLERLEVRAEGRAPDAVLAPY